MSLGAQLNKMGSLKVVIVEYNQKMEIHNKPQK